MNEELRKSLKESLETTKELKRVVQEYCRISEILRQKQKEYAQLKALKESLVITC